MGRKPHVQFRASAELVDAVERIASEEDISKSATWRDLARTGIQEHDGSYEAIKEQQQLETIKREENTRQRKAWFRSNVGSYLLKCWSNGLTPSEAADALMGYKREAQNIHESDELVSYLEEGLAIYEESHPDNGARLSTWLKSRVNQDTDAIDTQQQQQQQQQQQNQKRPKPESNAAEHTDADHPDQTVEEAAREFYNFGFDPDHVTHDNCNNISNGDYLEVRERLEKLYQEDSE